MMIDQFSERHWSGTDAAKIKQEDRRKGVFFCFVMSDCVAPKNDSPFLSFSCEIFQRASLLIAISNRKSAIP
jgi:hypothetical protein